MKFIINFTIDNSEDWFITSDNCEANDILQNDAIALEERWAYLLNLKRNDTGYKGYVKKVMAFTEDGNHVYFSSNIQERFSLKEITQSNNN